MAQSFSLCMVGMEAIVVKWLHHVERVDLPSFGEKVIHGVD
jgi:hypothetical protein